MTAPHVEHLSDDVTLYRGDCREILPTLGRVDAVVTDPPYGIGAASGFGSGKLAAVRDYGNKTWDDKTADEGVALAIQAARRAIIFGGNYYAMQPSAGWLVWDKLNGGNNFADCELAWTNIPMAVRRLQYRWNGMLRQNNEPRGDHPTQKPVGVMRWCLGFLPDARTILDPFMGSGTTGVACVQLGRKFTGIEIDQSYFDIACRRIADELRRPRLDLGEPVVAPVQEAMQL